MKTKDQSMDLYFSFWISPVLEEIESNSVFSLHLLIFCKPSKKVLNPIFRYRFWHVRVEIFFISKE